MSASICGKCGGYVCLQDEDGQKRCLNCGRVANPITPLGIPLPNSRHLGMSNRDKLRGTKLQKLSLAPNPGGAKG